MTVPGSRLHSAALVASRMRVGGCRVSSDAPLSGHCADENRDGFGRGRLTLAVVVGERQQRVGLRIVGCRASALELIRQPGETADPSLPAIAVEGFDFDEPAGRDTTRRNVVLVHEDDGPGAVDASIT